MTDQGKIDDGARKHKAQARCVCGWIGPTTALTRPDDMGEFRCPKCDSTWWEVVHIETRTDYQRKDKAND
jgi:predicted RNA-binding Zn-ribbon protein involved in translation (DUF1610 family)